MKKLYLIGLLAFVTTFSFAQTPGLIYKTAGTGSSVLDPNGDGYMSALGWFFH